MGKFKRIMKRIVEFLIWKAFIIVYFLSITGLSLFTWTNIRFDTLNSRIGIINFSLAIILKIS